MKILTPMGKGLKSLFLPELCRCAVCGEEREMVENTGFCQRCWAELPHREEPLTIKESLAVISPFSYTGTAEEMVKGLKFHNQRYLAEALGCVMAQACRQRGLEAEVLVPVPLGKARLRERGYNQAALLAEGMAAWMLMCSRIGCGVYGIPSSRRCWALYREEPTYMVRLKQKRQWKESVSAWWTMWLQQAVR